MRTRILLVLILVLFAGCTSIPTLVPPGGDGDQVSEGLEISLAQLESFALENENVNLRLRVENIGQGTAEDIQAQLFGAVSSSVRDVGTLQGTDEATGQGGDTAIERWEVPSPVDPGEGETETVEVGVKVSYDYDTQATIPITLSSKSFVASPSTVSVRNTAGPLRVSSDLQTPIPTEKDGKHTVPITVTKTGEGDIEGDVFLQMELVDTPQGVSLDCGSEPVQITITERGTTTCTLQTPQGGVSFETEVPLQVNASYTYSQETTTSVKVRGIS